MRSSNGKTKLFRDRLPVLLCCALRNKQRNCLLLPLTCFLNERMILGIGVDIVLLPRIAALVKRRSGEKLARRILSPPEFKDWKRFQGIDDQHRVRFLAVRYAMSLHCMGCYHSYHWPPVGLSKKLHTRPFIQQLSQPGKSYVIRAWMKLEKSRHCYISLIVPYQARRLPGYMFLSVMMETIRQLL